MLSPSFPLSRAIAWERVPEGRVRALGLTHRMLVQIVRAERKSLHPAFGHLLPRFAREKGKDSEGARVYAASLTSSGNPASMGGGCAQRAPKI